MWTYNQANGVLVGPALRTPVQGYSGFDLGKNNPVLERVHDVGPIPKGNYTIGPPFDSPEHGPLAMRLTPDDDTDTFGRGGFLMHGDSLEHPGEASHGCIIMPRFVRQAVAASADRSLQVV